MWRQFCFVAACIRLYGQGNHSECNRQSDELPVFVVDAVVVELESELVEEAELVEEELSPPPPDFSPPPLPPDLP